MKGKKSRGWGVCEGKRKKKSRKEDTKDYQKCNLIFFFFFTQFLHSFIFQQSFCELQS